jgi:hypothetical protein
VLIFEQRYARVQFLPNTLIAGVTVVLLPVRRSFLMKKSQRLGPFLGRPALPVLPARSRSLVRPNC